MPAAFTIAHHHLRRLVRSPGLILVLLAIPITLALIEYFAFGQTAAAGKLPPIKVLFLDEDKTFVSGAVPQFFSGGPLKGTFEIAQVSARAEAERMFRANEASALVVTAKGFQAAVLEGRRAELALYRNPIQTYSPVVVGSVLEMMEVIVNGLYAQAGEPLRRVRELDAQKRDPSSEDIAAIAVGFYEAGRRLQRFGSLGDLQVPVERPGEASSTRIGPNPQDFFAFIFPGLAMFALLFIGQALSVRLLRDRMRGIQRRVAMTPTRGGSVLAGNVLYMLAGLFSLLLLLTLIGAVVFRIQLREPGALLLLGLGFAVFTTGLHLFVISMADTDRGAAFVCGVVVMVLSLLGGTFVPAESYPPALRALSVALPNGAAQQGIVDVLVHKKTILDVASAIVTTWGWGVVLLATALHFERRTLHH